MPYFNRRFSVAVIVCFLLSFVPASAWAADNDLKVPTIAASVAAAADWATTYHALKNYKVHETNPMLRPFDGSPRTLITLGSVIDAGMVSGWNLTVGKKNPPLAAAGLWAMTAFRAYLAIHNMRNMNQAERR
jgi:hypothetical protein